MTVEGLHAREKFAIVSAGDEDLCVVAHGGLEERERPGGEFVCFEDRDLVFSKVCAWFGLEFSGDRLAVCLGVLLVLFWEKIILYLGVCGRHPCVFLCVGMFRRRPAMLNVTRKLLGSGCQAGGTSQAALPRLFSGGYGRQSASSSTRTPTTAIRT